MLNLNNFNSLDPFFRAGLSVDIVLLTFSENKLKILLEKKKEVMFNNQWGLPGKIIFPNEDTDKAIDQILTDCIGTNSIYKKQLASFSDIGRHPLGRVVSFAYYGLVPHNHIEGKLLEEQKWVEISQVHNLILDHDGVLKKVLSRFKKGLLRHPIVFQILPQKFVISDIIAVYEQAFDKKIEVRNFRKKLLSSDLLMPLGEIQKSSIKNGRPAQLYSLNELDKKNKEQIYFELSIFLTRMLKHI